MDGCTTGAARIGSPDLSGPIRRAGILLTATGLLLFSGCYYDREEEVVPTDDPVSFSADVQTIFDNDCTVCHPSISPTLDLTSGNSYESLFDGGFIDTDNPEASILYQRLIGTPSIMPPTGSLPNSNLVTVLSWIEQGALDN